MIRDLVTLQERMNRLFDEAFPSTSRSGQQEGQEFFSNTWVPAVDIYEDENSTTIKADIPGIDPESLDIRVEDNRLFIRGERKLENEIKRENFRQVERSYGSFTRVFMLPPNIASDQIEATYKNGELRLTLPKREEAKSKQIKITSEGSHERQIGKSEGTTRQQHPGQRQQEFRGRSEEKEEVGAGTGTGSGRR